MRGFGGKTNLIEFIPQETVIPLMIVASALTLAEVRAVDILLVESIAHRQREATSLGPKMRRTSAELVLSERIVSHQKTDLAVMNSPSMIPCPTIITCFLSLEPKTLIY